MWAMPTIMIMVLDWDLEFHLAVIMDMAKAMHILLSIGVVMVMAVGQQDLLFLIAITAAVI